MQDTIRRVLTRKVASQGLRKERKVTEKGTCIHMMGRHLKANSFALGEPLLSTVYTRIRP